MRRSLQVYMKGDQGTVLPGVVCTLGCMTARAEHVKCLRED